MVHGPSDGNSLRVYDTDYGRLGGLICGENSNPLAKYALFARQEAIHVAAWPAFMHNFGGDFILQQYAFEGHLFVISASDYFSADIREAMGEAATGVELGGGSSAIYGPRGQIIAKAKPDREEILVAEIDLEDLIKTKMFTDTTGHYNRFDLFKFSINDDPQSPITPGGDRP